MDGHLGYLERLAPDGSLPQGNRCSCSSESTVHVFLVALCTYRLYTPIEFAHLTRFRSPAFHHLRFAFLIPRFMLSTSLLRWPAALRREEMEPRCEMAGIQAVSSHRHIFFCTAKANLPGKPLCFGHFSPRSELVLYDDNTLCRSEHDAVANDDRPSVASQMEFYFKSTAVSFALQSIKVSLEHLVFGLNVANAQLSPHHIRLLILGIPFSFGQSNGYSPRVVPDATRFIISLGCITKNLASSRCGVLRRVICGSLKLLTSLRVAVSPDHTRLGLRQNPVTLVWKVIDTD